MRAFFSINGNHTRQSKIASHTCLNHASLGGLPSEVRFQIFKNLIEDDVVKAVGYSNGYEDVFTFKEKGYSPLPVMLTCRQFRAEMHEVYFKTISVSIKAVFTTAFNGDMSAFASDYFRRNVRDAKISDHDTDRRKRISGAFPQARIELVDRGAACVRKGAYYFG